MTKLKPHTKYKDSGVEWLGEIPDDWNVKRTKVLFKPIDERSKDGSEQLLSVSEHVGVKPRNQMKITMFQAESYEGYKLCQKGDLVINSLWAWKRGLGFSEYSGIVSTAYGVYRPKKSSSIDYKFFHYLYRTKKYVDQLFIASRGIWKSRMQLSDSSFLNVIVAYPELETQIKARKYIEEKENDIDKYIKKLKKEISLLKEHRQKIISQAVTCGLDENGKLRKKPVWNEGDPVPNGWKDSGVEWLGLVPKGWDVKRAKYLFKPIDERSKDGSEQLLSVSEHVGVKPRDELKITMFQAESYEGYKLCEKGDLVVNSLWAWKCGLGFSEYSGIVSTAYGVYRLFNNKLFDYKYFHYLLRTKKYIDQFFLESRGIWKSRMSLTDSAFLRIYIMYPEAKEQLAISTYLEEVELRINSHIGGIENQIKLITEYKQSLISKVVTGKIDVRNINNNLSEN